jgi:hypothetical protein
MKDISEYLDIIEMAHPDPDPIRHPRMSMHERAAQFAPFAALTGFDEVISDTADAHNSI